jgi:hypothetical protein
MAAKNTESLQLNQDVLDAHEQRSQMTCLPMAVEFVLKLLGKIPPGSFELQDAWIDGRRDFREFDGKVIHGVRFESHYTPPNRGDDFPLEELFSTIEQQFRAGRYVIISLPANGNYHNWIIYNQLPNGEFEAVTKGREPDRINNVREIVRDMKGTDILTYELI